jgi:5-(carboxyamino)imidazole ribonucleotide mutase
MPPGVPVATVGIDSAKNAALLAVQILATANERLAGQLDEFRADQAEQGMEHREIGGGSGDVGFGFQAPAR